MIFKHCQADDKFTDAISMDPAEALIFLNWGHVHCQRAIIYNSMGNASDAEEQLRLAKDMYVNCLFQRESHLTVNRYDTALKSNSMITEAKTSLAELDTLLASSHSPVASGGATTLSQGGTRNTAGPSNASYKPVQVTHQFNRSLKIVC